MNDINRPGNESETEDRPREAQPFPRKLTLKHIRPAWIIAVIALACIPFAVHVHHAVFHFLRQLHIKGFFAAATQFPSATFVVLILASIAILDRRRAHLIAYFLVALTISSSINDTIKYVTGRARPRYSVLMGHVEKQWIRNYRDEHPGVKIHPTPTDQWIGIAKENPRFFDGYSSFPSGHSNSSFVLAAFLSAMYPQGRVLWCLAAAGTAAARVEGMRHWPEDVMFGGALGWIIAQIVFSWRWPLRMGLWVICFLARLASFKKRIPSRDGAIMQVESVNP